MLETIDNVAKGEIRTKIRDMLGAFLFRGEDVDKKVKVLSGGERSRLAMVKLLLEPCNLLVLDEPTNHLDMRSKDILKQALLKYDGTLIVVSHDRDFLDGLVTKVFEFRHNRIKEHLGGIYDFLRNKKIDNLKEIEKKEKTSSDNRKEDATSNKQKYLDKKEYERSLRKLRKKLGDSEQRIGEIEAELSETNLKLMNNTNPADSDALYKRYEDLKTELDTEMSNWADYSHEVEEFIKISDQNGISET